MSKYEVVMGLEVHVELAVESKLFCACSAKFGAEPNENVCPACAGMPGMPAVLNKRAVDLGIAAALVTNSELAEVMTFDKKNYYYPDLPAAYQNTQLYNPLCKNGWVDIIVNGTPKRITLSQIHIEADAGKLVHDARSTLVDYNRSCVPLIEIVSNPDFRSADEVIAYLEKLKSLLSFAGVSDCKMQEGSMRCDVNISLRKMGDTEYGVRTEIKNMNSLKAITNAIAFEIERHTDILDGGEGELIQETRRWDDDCGESFSMRGKENATDYRYFPDPEIMPVRIDEGWVKAVRESLPETAENKYERMTKELGLSEYDSRIITGSRNLSFIFDETAKYYNKPKDIVNWIIGELMSIVKGEALSAEDIDINCAKLAKIIELVDTGTVNRGVGKKLLALVLSEDIEPETYVKEKSLGMVSDTGLIEKAIHEILAENVKSVNEYKEGNEKALTFLMGQVMRRMSGKANHAVVKELLLREITQNS